MRALDVAVLGLGSMGLRHVRNLLLLDQRVVGFDPDPERRRLLRALGGVATTDRDSALRRADAAVVASPNGHHRSDIDAAVEAGCHLFIEKPVAHVDDGMDRTLGVRINGDRTLFAGFNLRFHPCVQAAKETLDGGLLGTPLWARLTCATYLPAWRPDQDYRVGYAADRVSGGVIFDTVHEIDLAVLLLGPATPRAAVARNTGTLEIRSDDCADIVLRHDRSGTHSSIHLDYVTRPRMRVTEIVGTEGALTLDLDARRMTRVAPDGTVVEDRRFGGEWADDYVAEMRSFLNCIQGADTPRCGGPEALSVLRLVLEIRRMAGLPQA